MSYLRNTSRSSVPRNTALRVPESRRDGQRPHRRSGGVICVARDRLPGKYLTGSNVVSLSAKHTYDKVVMRHPAPDATLNSYMKGLSQDFSVIKMPLGANLKKLSPTEYEILVPKIQLFEVWFAPRASASVRFLDHRMELASSQCLLEGSSHVNDLKLNDVFNLDVKVAFSWKESGSQPTIMSEASIDVDVDVPMPFALIPKPVLETTGNAAFAITLNLMLNGFVEGLAQDYDRWGRDAQLRQQRMTAAKV